MSEPDKIVARCVIRLSGFTEAQIEGKSACPNCGDKGVPMSPDQDVTLSINWHELRVLSLWAERWALKHSENNPEMLKTVYAIASRLQEQCPSLTPLTLTGELKELKKQYPSMETNIATDEQIESAPLPTKIS